jgi:hypothetical protein
MVDGTRHLTDIAVSTKAAVQALQSGQAEAFASAVAAAKADSAKVLALSEAFSQVSGAGQIFSAAEGIAAAAIKGELPTFMCKQWRSKQKVHPPFLGWMY